MKRWTLSAALAFAGLAFGAVHAQDANPNAYQGYYISGVWGGSFLPFLHFSDATSGVGHEHFDDGMAWGGALGYNTGDGIRYELDSLYQSSPVKSLAGSPASGHISSTGLMANATYDLLHDSVFTPYVGAGLGFENVGGNIDGFTGRQWRPAYQAEAGLRAAVADNVSLFGEYRFTQSESATLRNAGVEAHQHFSDHALLAGVSYNLN
jgi:opacity protein-like surface antigen